MPGGNPDKPQEIVEILSPEDIKNRRQALAEQKRKTEELKMVLAVVGTMKAGKSTTINAIVGREILPNRNRPMTALPTLIEHKRGQKTPVLHFEKRKPIEELAERLRKKIKQMQPREREKITDGDTHLEKTLTNLLGKNEIATSHKGEENIFRFLEWLNDMVRLATALGDQFPFEQYKGIDDFPRIEVEFFHLAALPESGPGKLLILDTPGFNEDGQQEHLLPMMQEQLKKATAVLTVLDYTQLKSKSEGELRAELNAIAEQSKGRMFALVNKFDQCDSNSMNESDTRNYVSRKLLSNIIPSEKIFPASSRMAYLSQRAQLALSEGGIQWQEGQKESWIDDFGEEAFGKRWKKLISDSEEVKDGARELWEDSLFNNPLENVIRFVYRNAAYQVIDAAAAELGKNAPDLVREVRGRLQAQNVEPKKLRQIIEEIQKKIQRLDVLREKNQSEITRQLASVREFMEDKLGKAEEKAEKEALSLLKENQSDPKEHFKPEILEVFENQEWFSAKDKESIAKEIDAWMKNLPNNFAFYSVLVGILKERRNWPSKKHIQHLFTKEDFNEEGENAVDMTEKITRKMRIISNMKTRRLKKILEKKTSSEKEDGIWFERQEDIIGTIETLSNTITDLMNGAGEDVANAASKKIHVLASEMTDLQKKVSDDISGFTEHAKEAKLDAIAFQAPEPFNLQELGVDLTINNGSFIKAKSTTEKKYIKQDSWWGGFKRTVDIFGMRLGFDEISVPKTYFQLDEEGMIEYWGKQIKIAMQSLRDQVETGFIQPVQQSSDDFFAKVLGCFSHVRQILENGMNDQLRAKDEAERLIKELQQMQRESEDTQKGANEIKKWAEKHTEHTTPRAA